jgi:hypothetical protein
MLGFRSASIYLISLLKLYSVLPLSTPHHFSDLSTQCVEKVDWGKSGFCICYNKTQQPTVPSAFLLSLLLWHLVQGWNPGNSACADGLANLLCNNVPVTRRGWMQPGSRCMTDSPAEPAADSPASSTYSHLIANPWNKSQE